MQESVSILLFTASHAGRPPEQGGRGVLFARPVGCKLGVGGTMSARASDAQFHTSKHSMYDDDEWRMLEITTYCIKSCNALVLMVRCCELNVLSIMQLTACKTACHGFHVPTEHLSAFYVSTQPVMAWIP
jgi:hypothetical protein